MTTRRALLLAGASAALSGCGIQTWVEQPGRRIFRNHTLYRRWGAEIVAFARGRSAFYSLEAPTERSGGTVGLCKVDLDDGKATLRCSVKQAMPRLAVSNDDAWLVMSVGATATPYLHRVALADMSPPEKLFQVPDNTFLVADAAGAWTYRVGERVDELVRVTATTVEIRVENVKPGALTVSPHGVFFDSTDGLFFLAAGEKPVRIADGGAVPIVGGGRTLLCSGERIVELDPSGARVDTIGEVKSLPGRPCAAMFGGVLFATAGSSSPRLLREDMDATGVGLHLWHPEEPGWDTAMDIPTGRMLFGAVDGPSFLVATDSAVIEVF